MNEYLIPVFLSVISTLLVLSIKGIYENFCRFLLYVKFINSIQTKHHERLFNILKFHGKLIAEKFDMNYEYQECEDKSTVSGDSINLSNGKLYWLIISAQMVLHYMDKHKMHNFHNDGKGNSNPNDKNSTYHPEIVKDFKRYLINKLFFNFLRNS